MRINTKFRFLAIPILAVVFLLSVAADRYETDLVAWMSMTPQISYAARAGYPLRITAFKFLFEKQTDTDCRPIVESGGRTFASAGTGFAIARISLRPEAVAVECWIVGIRIDLDVAE